MHIIYRTQVRRRKNFRNRRNTLNGGFCFYDVKTCTCTNARAFIFIYTHVPRVEGLLSFIQEENKRPIATKRESECYIRHEIKNYTSYRRPWRARHSFWFVSRDTFHKNESSDRITPENIAPTKNASEGINSVEWLHWHGEKEKEKKKKILFPQDFFPPGPLYTHKTVNSFVSHVLRIPCIPGAAFRIPFCFPPFLFAPPLHRLLSFFGANIMNIDNPAILLSFRFFSFFSFLRTLCFSLSPLPLSLSLSLSLLFLLSSIFS